MPGKMPRVYRCEAVVLRQRRLGEADRILTLYTPQLGKLDAVAKGVRKQTSRKAGHLEPFTLTALLVAGGRNLDIITQAETVESFQWLVACLGGTHDSQRQLLAGETAVVRHRQAL